MIVNFLNSGVTYGDFTEWK